jgi:hypothetical protein
MLPVPVRTGLGGAEIERGGSRLAGTDLRRQILLSLGGIRMRTKSTW